MELDVKDKPKIKEEVCLIKLKDFLKDYDDTKSFISMCKKIF